MPKAFGREIPTWMLIGGGLIVIVLLYNQMTGGEEPVAAKSTRKARPTASKNITYTQEDRTAKFAVYTEPPKNTFKPLIAKAPSGTLAVQPLNIGGLATTLTGGEANWFYTGHVEVNGRAQALLENTSTGEAVYLSEGEKWKTATVQDIAAEKVVFSGATGAITVPLKDPNEQKRGGNVVPPGGVAPMNPAPALAGQIGGQMAGMQPGVAVPGQPNGTVSPFDGLTVQPDNGTRGNGRRGGGGRRNRGNWGGAPQQ